MWFFKWEKIQFGNGKLTHDVLDNMAEMFELLPQKEIV